MQADNHFYVTFLLACRAGIDLDTAELIAWADQYTDECMETGHAYALETQTTRWDKARESQFQVTTLIPFHFVPGDLSNDFGEVLLKNDKDWLVEAGSNRAGSLVAKAINDKDPVRLGVALHAFQDTWSHQGFTGAKDDRNSCFPWYAPASALPNIGHAEMLVVPDVTNYVWTDPRTGEQVDNRKRFMEAARTVFRMLFGFYGVTCTAALTMATLMGLREAFAFDDYGERITAICKLTPRPAIDYHEVSKRLLKTHAKAFHRAAQAHLADAMRSFDDLWEVQG